MTHRFRHGLGLVATAAVLTTASLAASAGTNLIVNGDFADTNSTWYDNTGMGGDDMQLGGTMPPGWTGVPGRANDIWVGGRPTLYGLTASPGNGSGYFLDLTGRRRTSSRSVVSSRSSPPRQGRCTRSPSTLDIRRSTTGPFRRAPASRAGRRRQHDPEFQRAVIRPRLADKRLAHLWQLRVRGGRRIDDRRVPVSSRSPSGICRSRQREHDAAVVAGQSAPIPEPAEMAMLLAGLGMVGVAARSRAQPKANIVSA